MDSIGTIVLFLIIILFVTSNQYQMDSLKAICEQSLCSNLSLDNATELYQLADLYGASELKTRARDLLHKYCRFSKIPFKKLIHFLFASHPSRDTMKSLGQMLTNLSDDIFLEIRQSLLILLKAI